MEERLNQAHASLSLQEEAAHRAEREKRSLEEELAQLRASLQAAQAESRALQVRKKQNIVERNVDSIFFEAEEILFFSLYRTSWRLFNS